MMEITEVKVYPVSEEKLKAYVTVTFGDSLVVRDLKIIQGNNRLFVAMPSRRMKDGTFRDVVHPSNSDMRQKLEKIIFEKYEEAVQNNHNTEYNNVSSYEASIM
jgi:stage V sporulation protein G